MKLKICGLNDRENILEVLETKPDYLGLVFYKDSPRYAGGLAPEFVYQITGVRKIGVFVNESEINILDRVARYGLDFVQLHGNETSEFCALIARSVPVIKAFQVDDRFDIASVNSYEKSCRYFLFDSKSEIYGGSGNGFDHDKLKRYSSRIPFFLSGGLSLENISDIKINSYALDVNSKFESSPGIKDIQKIKTLKEKMKHDLRG